MRLIIEPDYSSLSNWAANYVAKKINAANPTKEKPFVLGKEAGEIYPEMESTERVLIQGIVDVFFIEDGKVHVLDYKTDRVNKGEQLIGRYKTQIELYAEALAKALEVEVGEKLIYSFALEKIVRL